MPSPAVTARSSSPPPPVPRRQTVRLATSCRPPQPRVREKQADDRGDRRDEKIKRDEEVVLDDVADGDVDGNRSVHPGVDDEGSFARAAAMNHRGRCQHDGDYAAEEAR